MGTLLVWKPLPIQSIGGVGWRGQHEVVMSYSTNESVGFGVFFLIIAVFLLCAVWRMRGK